MKTKLLMVSALALMTAPAFAQDAEQSGGDEAPIVEAAAVGVDVSSPTPIASSVDEAVVAEAANEAAAISETAGALPDPAPAAPATKPTLQVVSRGADGTADVVSLDGQNYNVCKGEVQDSCINPRTAGLNFGARDLQYWPGRPASEISTPLPAAAPVNQPIEDAGLAG